MATITANPGAAPRRRVVRPLSWLEMFLFPLLVWGKVGSDRAYWVACRGLTVKRREDARDRAEVQKMLRAEAKLFGAILISEWVRLGGYYSYKWRVDQTTLGAPTRRRKRMDKVQFQCCYTTPEAIWFKLRLGRISWLGHYISLLPHKVRVTDLVSEESLTELADAVGRPVTVERDPLHGVWLCVHRNGSRAAIADSFAHVQALEHVRWGNGDITLVVGAGEHRSIHSFDFENYPHILVAGASGGGKSNMINNLLCQLIRFLEPSELQLILIDPKRLEFTFYKGVPHLARPIVYEPVDAIALLEDMITVVHERTALLEGKAKKLSDYNAKHPDAKLPRILIVVEELAALMRNKKLGARVTEALSQLASLGRAAGVHLLLCTQMPISEIISITIKASMWVRISGRVMHWRESQVILGTDDASRLPAVPGRMVYSMDADKHEIQTPLIDESDIHIAIAIAKARAMNIIQLDGWQPVIDKPGLIALCIERLAGRVEFAELCQLLAPVTITKGAVRAFIEDLLQQPEILFNGQTFRLTKTQSGLEFVSETGVYRQAPGTNASVIIDRRLNAPAPIKLLGTGPIPEPEPEPPDPRERFRGLSHSEILDVFVQEQCETDWTVKTAAKLLYEDYERWAKVNGLLKTSKQKFGNHLKNAGYKSMKTTTGHNAWVGIKLIERS